MGFSIVVLACISRVDCSCSKQTLNYPTLVYLDTSCVECVQLHTLDVYLHGTLPRHVSRAPSTSARRTALPRHILRGMRPLHEYGQRLAMDFASTRPAWNASQRDARHITPNAFASARPAWNASSNLWMVSWSQIFASTRPAWNASAKMCKAYRAVLWNVS